MAEAARSSRRRSPGPATTGQPHTAYGVTLPAEHPTPYSLGRLSHMSVFVAKPGCSWGKSRDLCSVAYLPYAMEISSASSLPLTQLHDSRTKLWILMSTPSLQIHTGPREKLCPNPRSSEPQKQWQNPNQMFLILLRREDSIGNTLPTYLVRICRPHRLRIPGHSVFCCHRQHSLQLSQRALALHMQSGYAQLERGQWPAHPEWRRKMAGAWVVSIVSCRRCGKGVARWGEHGPRSGISQQSESLLRRYCTVRRVGEIGLGSCSAFPSMVSGPLCWRKRTVRQYRAASVNVTPITGHHVGEAPSSTPPLRPPEPLPSRRLRGRDKLLSLSVQYHGFIRCAAASLRPTPGKASFATWQAIQSCRLHSPARPQPRWRLGRCRACRGADRVCCVSRPRRTVGGELRFVRCLSMLRRTGAIATMQFIGRISGDQRTARAENVPSHMRPGWYSNCTYRAPSG
jgi:hypothetical protein